MQPTSWQSVIQSGRLPDAEVKRGRAASSWILPQDPTALVHTWLTPASTPARIHILPQYPAALPASTPCSRLHPPAPCCKGVSGRDGCMAPESHKLCPPVPRCLR